MTGHQQAAAALAASVLDDAACRRWAELTRELQQVEQTLADLADRIAGETLAAELDIERINSSGQPAEVIDRAVDLYTLWSGRDHAVGHVHRIGGRLAAAVGPPTLDEEWGDWLVRRR